MRLILLLSLALFTSCADTGPYPSSRSLGPANMGGPTTEERSAQIASEPQGKFFYGRRYHVKKTRFWGYLRKPGQSANEAKLVILNETKKLAPDRLPEGGARDSSYGFDNNYEYKLSGYYSGKNLYEPNSNQILPEFVLTDYKLLKRNPGWLFSPKDHFNPVAITLRPR